ncbi:MAG: DUF169 domain-containing protein [Candidatus Jordarchaeaceae archaeon]
MEWKEYAEKITKVLGLKGNPIAVTYSTKPPSKSTGRKCRVCDAFLHVRNGEIIDLTASTLTCPGGIWHLGLGERPRGEAAKAFKEFLVNGEKLYCSIATLHRSQVLTVEPPLGLADHVILSPLNEAEFRPDIVIFICNAEQACRLVTLYTYYTGIPPKTEMIGSTCHQAITYPLVSGELNISLMDYTSRRTQGYGPEELIFSTPYYRFHGIIRSIEHCSAGTAKSEIPESFQRLAKTNPSP